MEKGNCNGNIRFFFLKTTTNIDSGTLMFLHSNIFDKILLAMEYKRSIKEKSGVSHTIVESQWF